MSHTARPYQLQFERAIYESWEAGKRVVMGVLPTGGGKTVVIGNIADAYDFPSFAIAHRQELVSQISVALGREGIRHDLIVPDNVRRTIVRAHINQLGRNFIVPGSHWRVAGVDTLIKLKEHERRGFDRVGLVVQDEGHHVLKANKWGRAFEMFPHARGLFPTATPQRADGKGLGSHADGLVDSLVIGPSMRELIDMGYLTDYRIFCPTTKDLKLDDVAISDTTGDFNRHELAKAIHASSRIVGDVVRHYLTISPGKLGVTFAVDVEEATKIAMEFNRQGVRAEVVSAKTPDDLRQSIIKRFAAREVMQLVNVDLFGEGFDLPAIEVVSMARPTASYSLFCQQFGRSVRLMIDPAYAAHWDSYTSAQRKQIIAASNKPRAIVIDHVANVIRHGLPDSPRQWTLDRRASRSSGGGDSIPLKICLNCASPYERFLTKCPYCGAKSPPPMGRGIEFVDGDLTELDEATLASMRKAVAAIDEMAGPGAPHYITRAINSRAAAQYALRDAIAYYGGAYGNHTDSENYRRFYLDFGIDVLSAQSLPKPDAEALRVRIVQKLIGRGFNCDGLSEVPN